MSTAATTVLDRCLLGADDRSGCSGRSAAGRRLLQLQADRVCRIATGVRFSVCMAIVLAARALSGWLFLISSKCLFAGGRSVESSCVNIQPRLCDRKAVKCRVAATSSGVSHFGLRNATSVQIRHRASLCATERIQRREDTRCREFWRQYVMGCVLQQLAPRYQQKDQMR